MPADALKWKLKTRQGSPVGYAYRDSNVSADGVRSFKLQSGAADAAKASVVGKGFRVGPNNVVPLVEPVRVWIADSANAVCWGSDFSGAQIKFNGFGKFTAKAL